MSESQNNLHTGLNLGGGLSASRITSKIGQGMSNILGFGGYGEGQHMSQSQSDLGVGVNFGAGLSASKMKSAIGHGLSNTFGLGGGHEGGMGMGMGGCGGSC